MQEPSDRKRESQKEPEATSKETLEDLEDSEKSSAGKQGGRKEADVPSPDGAFNEEKESNDAGPM